LKARAALAGFAAAFLAAPAFPAGSAPAILAVLSADTRPYQEAWDGFREELGDPAAMTVVGAPGSDASIESARVVVAFGSKAALNEYPGRVLLILAMAPSIEGRRRGNGRIPHVSMTPSPKVLLAGLRALQPGLKRLAVVWKSEFYGADYQEQLLTAGKAIGIDIRSVEVAESREIPDLLRSLYGHVDAVWMPPDPLVISESNFLVFRDFSLSNGVPLYVPIPSLAERGATASVGVSFRAVGRASARVAKRVLAGGEAPALTFAEPAETTLNSASAAKVGLNVDAETLKKLSRVIP
jgi:ABC transporter substrate binding protein